MGTADVARRGLLDVDQGDHGRVGDEEMMEGEGKMSKDDGLADMAKVRIGNSPQNNRTSVGVEDVRVFRTAQIATGEERGHSERTATEAVENCLFWPILLLLRLFSPSSDGSRRPDASIHCTRPRRKAIRPGREEVPRRRCLNIILFV